MQRAVVKSDEGEGVRIEDVALLCSTPRAKLDENIAFTISFKLNGAIRRNFVQRFWQAAYDQHDAGLRLAYRTGLRKAGLRLLPKPLKEEKFVRRAVFFWTRNPELPYRVWATIATEFDTILYPKTEGEAQGLLFDVTRSFELDSTRLGKGLHSLEAVVAARWGKHVFIEKGEALARSRPIKVRID